MAGVLADVATNPSATIVDGYGSSAPYARTQPTGSSSMADIEAAIAEAVAAANAPRQAVPVPVRPRAIPSAEIDASVDSGGSHIRPRTSGGNGNVAATVTRRTRSGGAGGAAGGPPANVPAVVRESAASAAYGIVYHGERVVCFYCHPDATQLGNLSKKPPGVCKNLRALARHHMTFHAECAPPPYLVSELELRTRDEAAATRRNKKAIVKQLSQMPRGSLTAEQLSQLENAKPRRRLETPIGCPKCIPAEEQPPTSAKRGWFHSYDAAAEHWKSKHADHPLPDEFRHQRSRFTVAAAEQVYANLANCICIMFTMC